MYTALGHLVDARLAEWRPSIRASQKSAAPELLGAGDSITCGSEAPQHVRVSEIEAVHRLALETPAHIAPQQRWTGKQILT